VKNILEELNEEQKKAVVEIDGPIMVLAGAGSGKTRVLTYRIAYLLKKGVDPFNILSLTFTNKAAREMKERVFGLVANSDAKNVWMGTFHSIFARILRIESEKLGYPSNFTIYDSDDSKSLIKSIIKEQNLDDKQYVANYVLNRISAAKTNLISPVDYNKNNEIISQDKISGKPFIGELYTLYNKRCFKASAMDFDDLLFNMNVLLRDFPDVLYKYQQIFKYILVDEYQDTNYSQYLIVKKLAANNENVCVVGDDAQSIYAFRGANIQNILNLKTDYPDLKTYKLEQNYRSTQNIVNAANSIIEKNKDQIKKEIWTENEEGNKIQLLKANSDNEEGQLIANSIFEQKMHNQLQNDAFAILYRTNAQSRSMEEALRKLGIPYRIYGGLSFYKRKEIKDLLAYFRLVINQNDEEAFNRIINYPARGIGKTSLEKIVVCANDHDKSFWQIVENANLYPLGINSGTATKISDFVIMIKSFATMLKTKNAFELAKLIASSSGILKELYADRTPEGVSRHENIEELLNAIKDFTEKKSDTDDESIENAIKTLDEFMQDIALLTDADSDDKNDNNKVSLMTIHAAKGLEFPYVFIVGVEENLFPSLQSIGSRVDLEEERRLFYVAITRAMTKLSVSYATSRYKWGNLTSCEPSRFIEEIDEKYIDFPQKARVSSVFGNKANLNLSNTVKQEKITIFPKGKLIKASEADQATSKDFEANDSDEIQNGMEIEHQRFGKGKIINIEGTGSNKKATVFFQQVGQKQLLLKFAKLKIIK
jgi:DNA helicase-2/ATP-dependent DNA helicase PcrA